MMKIEWIHAKIRIKPKLFNKISRKNNYKYLRKRKKQEKKTLRKHLTKTVLLQNKNIYSKIQKQKPKKKNNNSNIINKKEKKEHIHQKRKRNKNKTVITKRKIQKFNILCEEQWEKDLEAELKDYEVVDSGAKDGGGPSSSSTTTRDIDDELLTISNLRTRSSNNDWEEYADLIEDTDDLK